MTSKILNQYAIIITKIGENAFGQKWNLRYAYLIATVAIMTRKFYPHLTIQQAVFGAIEATLKV